MPEIAKKTFLNEKNSIEQSDVVIVPFGLEKTIEYGEKGTRKGPQRIIEISPNLEFFDEELEKNVYKEVKIATLEEPNILENHEEAISQLEEIVDEIYKLNKFPLVLGGEHSLTLGPARAALKKYGEISILQFDAHADLRDEYEGTIYNHASVMRQCLKLNSVNLVQVGIRNISTDTNEFEFWKENQARIKTFWAKDMKDWKINEIVESLGESVYLTFDIDVFDSSLMPSTGTPEPGGLQWYQTMEILREVAKKKKIIGADVVELSPISGFYAPDFVAAKLVYKIIGYNLGSGIASKKRG
ncbi:MAG: agmatinase [Candidatus Portnoybacteria bacterium RBG_13_41_18]|uniref:Agmatinase n=1 Tax=Candidatus Portnoybacteria bacterium RBG_13_41_18 TaxID=1801991 RepID=A0A1G2F5V3_9BACT|nr:MAG: agmatinase [Candidatus Portnoybacteria bacterium RBG_13_41_18]